MGKERKDKVSRYFFYSQFPLIFIMFYEKVAN